MINEGISITTSAGKANAFMSHYASVSRLSFTKEERGRNRECKSMLRSPSVDGEQCREFTIPELESAINKMKAKLVHMTLSMSMSMSKVNLYSAFS